MEQLEIIKCKVCSIECNKQNNVNNENIAIIDTNGNVYCIKCKDILDFALDITIPSNIIKPPILSSNIKPIPLYICIKCKQNYTGSKCKCGFKNPLYR